MQKLKTVEIFTDGACRGNPGPGGWGVIMRYNGHEKQCSGFVANTTNNRMELTAIIQALNMLKEPCVIHVTTDSQYVHKGITEWIAAWKKNGWKTSNKTLVKNVDLWQQLEHATSQHNINWHWVKGHASHRENIIADQLATAAIDQQLKNK